MQAIATKTCANCGSELESAYKYCPQCTQTTHLHRFTIGHIAHELIHVFTHADKSIFSLIRQLATRPGHVAREYVLEGKRKKYFNPFTLLVLVLGFTLLMNAIYKPYTKAAAATAKEFEVRPGASEKKKQVFKELSTKQRNAMQFVETQTKIVVLLSIPVMALVFFLFFRKSGVNYAEHLVVLIILSAFTHLVSALLIPVQDWLGILVTSGTSVLLHMAFPLVYTAIGYYQFLRYERPVLYLKTGLAAVLATLAMQFVSGLVMVSYLAWGVIDKL